MRESDTEASQSLILGVDVVNGELRERGAVYDQGVLEWLCCRMAAGVEEEFGALGVLRGNPGQSTILMAAAFHLLLRIS